MASVSSFSLFLQFWTHNCGAACITLHKDATTHTVTLSDMSMSKEAEEWLQQLVDTPKLATNARANPIKQRQVELLLRVTKEYKLLKITAWLNLNLSEGKEAQRSKSCWWHQCYQIVWFLPSSRQNGDGVAFLVTKALFCVNWRLRCGFGSFTFPVPFILCWGILCTNGCVS